MQKPSPPDTQPAVPSLDTSRPFLRKDGLRAGLSRRALDGAGYRRIGFGVLVRATVPDSPRLRVQAALAPFPSTAFASHASAARIWEAPIPILPDEHVTVATYEERRKRAGIRCHVRQRTTVRRVGGVPVSDLPDLFVELTEQLGLVDLVVVGDWMLRRKGISLAQLRTVAEAAGPGARRRALAALAYVRPKVDSPMESRLRMLLVLAGLPEPRINVEVRDVDGHLLRRHDLGWPEVKVIVEYDGRHHVERQHQWEKDLRRREASDGDGWRTLVVVSRDVFATPGETVLRVWSVLHERGLAGVPARPRDDWRPHFPGHATAA